MYETLESNVCPKVKGGDILLDTVAIDQLPSLNLEVSLTLPDDLDYPASKEYGDTLRDLEMHITFYDGNLRPVHADPLVLQGWNIETFTSGTLDIVVPCPDAQKVSRFLGKEWTKVKVNYSLPLIAFHKYPSGPMEVTALIALRHVGYKSLTDSIGFNVTQKISTEFTCYRKKIKFTLEVPKLYQTDIFVGRVVIDDETFNSSWDFHLFGPGTPDVMWSLVYPCNATKYNDHSIFTSTCYRNTKDCFFDDSVALYHFSPDENVVFKIFDNDDVGYNDYISEWLTDIQSIQSDSGYHTIQDFEHLESFYVRAKTQHAN